MLSVLNAAEAGDVEALRAQLASGADPDEATPTNTTALAKAAHAGHAAAVAILLERGARTGIRDDIGGSTALLLACAGGHDAVVALLLQAGADAAERDDEGRSPLLYASRRGHAQVAALLLDHVLQAHGEAALAGFCDAADETGLTPLMAAAQMGETECCRALLGHWASVTPADDCGSTALHAAARRGRLGAVQEILRYGGRSDAVDMDGLTPAALAAAAGHADVASALEAGRALEQSLAEGAGGAPPVAEEYYSDGSYKSYDSAEFDRPWH